MDKKKKSHIPSEETDDVSSNGGISNESPTFVTEVVEEMENDEEIPEKPVAEKETVSKQIVSDEDEDEKKEIEKDFSVKEQEKNEPEFDQPRPESIKKQMVEDIFNPKQTNNLVDITINKRQTTQPAIVWAIIIIIVALVTGGGMILLTKTMGEKKEIAVKPTPIVAQISTPTPTPTTIKRGDLKIQVLNGGGKAGAGSKMKTFLTDLGYTVSAVGNTDAYTFEKTEIEVVAGKEGALELLRNDLAKDYSLGTMSAALASDSPYDVRVTVGK